MDGDSGEAHHMGTIIANNSIFLQKTVAPRVVVAVTCVFSMIGSSLIIFTYFAFKQLRNHMRHILLHLSFMDFGVAFANFVGSVVYFDRYYFEQYNEHGNYKVPGKIGYSCEIQAIVANTCNVSSVLWTIAVAVYLHFRVVSHSGVGKEKFFNGLVVGLAAVCYGIPGLLALWLTLTHRFGFAPYDSTGWCSLIVLSPDKKEDDILASVFGYDMWIYLAFILIPVLYFTIQRQKRRQYAFVKSNGDSTSKWDPKLINYKFILIPLVFMALRIWSVIVSIFFEYAKFDPDTDIPKALKSIILYGAGIGDSAQGAANGILFVILTESTRELIIQKIFCCCRKQTGHDKDSKEVTKSTRIGDESSPLLSDFDDQQYLPKQYESEGRTLVIIQDT